MPLVPPRFTRHLWQQWLSRKDINEMNEDFGKYIREKMAAYKSGNSSWYFRSIYSMTASLSVTVTEFH